MELGTGIFLSAVFLGTIALFIATKDRWPWKKIVLWPTLSALALVVVGGASWYLYEEYQSRPVRQTELWDISLGSSQADVTFAKGKPFKTDDEVWVYEPVEEQFYAIGFREGKVRYIVFHGEPYSMPKVAGANPYGTPEDLEERFGTPFVSRHKDETRRMFSYEKYNFFASFKAGGMASIGIYDAQTGPMKYVDAVQ